jgi:hypothetical protein
MNSYIVFEINSVFKELLVWVDLCYRLFNYASTKDSKYIYEYIKRTHSWSNDSDGFLQITYYTFEIV